MGSFCLSLSLSPSLFHTSAQTLQNLKRNITCRLSERLQCFQSREYFESISKNWEKTKINIKVICVVLHKEMHLIMNEQFSPKVSVPVHVSCNQQEPLGDSYKGHALQVALGQQWLRR